VLAGIGCILIVLVFGDLQIQCLESRDLELTRVWYVSDCELLCLQDIDVHAKVPKLHVKLKPDVVKVRNIGRSGILQHCLHF
jgi:hypothetical protein